MSDATVPRKFSGLPVRQLKVEVLTGPAAGTVMIDREIITVGTAQDNTLALTDPLVSRYHAELERSQNRIRLTDLGSTNGTHVGPVCALGSEITVEPGTTFTLGGTQLRVLDGAMVMAEAKSVVELGRLHSRSEAMQPIMDKLGAVAQSGAPVLLLGESGTGKELIARTLHEKSRRSGGPFVILDCAAITDSLFTSSLFGHERGAFTGAAQRSLGVFERAKGGTLFIDEIGELPLEHQAALLGVLERRTIQRVGGSGQIPVDVRIVSATNRDLRSEVNNGVFRLDLYYRLGVVLLRVPPLRSRSEDIPELIAQFLIEEGHSEPVESLFPEEAIARLRAHRWPGNIRELRNVVLASLAMGQPPSLLSEAPGGPINSASVIQSSFGLRYKDARRLVTDEFEAQYLDDLLRRAEGSVRQAARIAVMDRGYLSTLLRKHNIRRS